MFTTATTTLVAGRRVEATGRYRTWPILGSVLTLAGAALLATLTADSTVWIAAAFGAVLGSGIGFIMQTSLLALQNGVEIRDLGVATSAALLSRMLGVTMGAAAWSAVFQAGLAGHAGGTVGEVANAIPPVYLAAVPVALVTIGLALRLPEVTLREHTALDPAPL